MALIELLTEHRTAVWQTWRDRILETYPAAGAELFKKASDPFANPVGHTVSSETGSILDSLIGGADPGDLRPQLEKMLQIRSVQDFPPSEAVSFVFQLRDVIRQELANELADERIEKELRSFEARVEQLGMVAFDVYVACRERLFEVRVSELKRSINTLMRRVGNPDL